MGRKIKSRTLVLSIITILILSGYIVSFLYIKIGTKKIYNVTESHLIEKGYSKKDISEIEISHSYGARLLSYQEWIINVTFKNEPTVKYSYYYSDNKITQGSGSGILDDGIYDNIENPSMDYKNIIAAGDYIKKQGYRISKVVGQVDRYKLEKSMFQNTTENIVYKQVWSVQSVKPNDYFGKDVIVIGFNTRNHPLQKKDINAKDGVRLNIMIVEGKVIGGYSLPIIDTVGTCYSIDGEIKPSNI